MKILARAAMIILAISLLMPLLTCAIEYRPGEREAEYLFNHGIGDPWVGGNPPHSPYWSWPVQYYAGRPYADFQIRRYQNVDHGFSLFSDNDDGLQLRHWRGSYPVYRHYSDGRLRERFLSSHTSSGKLQVLT